LKTGEQPLLMEEFNCTPGQGISLELAIAFMQKLRELVNYYEFEGMVLASKIWMCKGSLTLHTKSMSSNSLALLLGDDFLTGE